MKIKDIKTFDDACNFCGTTAEDVKKAIDKYFKPNAFHPKTIHILHTLNESWKPNWKD